MNLEGYESGRSKNCRSSIINDTNIEQFLSNGRLTLIPAIVTSEEGWLEGEDKILNVIEAHTPNRWM